ncbi:MAG: hypothetical protein KKF30_19035 [Proteobacteria bacterium]|nr:hypothetical protein [Pseudomonadota bacterium]
MGLNEEDLNFIDRLINSEMKRYPSVMDTLFFPYAVLASGAITAIYVLLSFASSMISSNNLNTYLLVNLPFFLLGMILMITGNILIKLHGKRQEFAKIIFILRKLRNENSTDANMALHITGRVQRL